MRNQFATFATDPESWLRVYPKEFELPEDQKKAWIADRTGAIVGADTAKKYGWKVGQRVPIQGTIYRRPDGGPWEFTIDGIYDSKIKGADKTNLLFNYQYPERDDPRAERLRGIATTGTSSRSRIRDRAPEIAAKIDAMFANSPSETKTNTEKAFVVRLGEAGRRHRQDHDGDRGDGDVHDPARRRQHHGAGDPRAHQRAGGAEDAGLRRRTHPGLVLLESVFIALSAADSAWRCRTVHHHVRAIRPTGCCRRSTSRRAQLRRRHRLVAVLGTRVRIPARRGRRAGCASSTR